MLIKERWIFSRVVKISDFQILSSWIEKYKPALSKSVSSWDKSYLRLVIDLLAANMGKPQPFVSDDNFLCWVYNDFFLCGVIECLRM